MKSNRRLWAAPMLAGATLIMLSTPATFAQAQAQEVQEYSHSPIVVNQGDEVFMKESNGACTIGYIDRANRRAYTALHCANGSEASDKFGNPIGRFHTTNGPHEIGTTFSRRDVTYIELYDNVVAGNNIYSGDNRVRTSDVSVGDDMCMYSRMNNEVRCGKVNNVDGSIVQGNENVNGVRGDSGGPSWVDGKGFSGIYTLNINGGHRNNFTSIDDAGCSTDKFLNDPSIPGNGCDNSPLASYSPLVADNAEPPVVSAASSSGTAPQEPQDVPRIVNHVADGAKYHVDNTKSMVRDMETQLYAAHNVEMIGSPVSDYIDTFVSGEQVSNDIINAYHNSPMMIQDVIKTIDSELVAYNVI